MVRSVKRALQLLEEISKEKEIGIRDLSKRTGLSSSTVHRLVSVLFEKEYLTKNEENQKYQISFKLFQLGNKAIQQLDLRKKVRPILENLLIKVKETIILGILDDGDVVYIDKLSPPHEIQLASTVGSRVPIHCTATGKAILANLEQKERMRILRSKKLASYTLNTITVIQDLEKEFTIIRKRGYSVDKEERFLGVFSVAAPFYNYTHKVVGSVGIAGFVYNTNEEKVHKFGKEVQRVAQDINVQLGYI